jgi:hypothetical protein
MPIHWAFFYCLQQTLFTKTFMKGSVQ